MAEGSVIERLIVALLHIGAFAWIALKRIHAIERARAESVFVRTALAMR